MADEFHAGICGGAWWNSTKPVLTVCSRPCSTTLSDMGSFGHGTDTVDINPPHHRKLQQADSDSGGTSSSILIDSNPQMMGFGLPSSTTSDWNLSVLRSNGRTESYNLISQEDNDQDFPSEQPRLNSTVGFSDSIQTCLGLSTGFPIASVSYEYPSTLLQSLFESVSDPQTSHQSLFNNPSSISFTSSATSNYGANANELSPFISPSFPEQQFSNNTPSWNASATAINDVKTDLLPSPKSQFSEEVRNFGSAMKKGSSEPAFKRAKFETPSPLPTFKVRKEKLGDRITALQQLVSPFGKTDTASVLHEAIEYIKFLHDQVNVLSTPSMKQTAASIQQEVYEKRTDEPKQDLRSRGLCLVPISNTFPVTNETTADFWTPTFGGTLR
ncbi:bHLH123 protein [Hibiscus syriacus]|uniref:BHLH123 protein n=1 Tax=Hibiscus syriacus TaxID=106335 RepID=A0A6A3C7D9_HIBSY|nr:transcription factor bHLH112-like [Hibiscus syriacus]KAE8724437.1 bHLH123 protein [Hibiscus syriacus]